MIELAVVTADLKRKVAGAIFGRSEPRIVKIDDVYVDATPKGWVLIIHNYDRPGVIGAVGTFLGKHKVNINRLQLGLSSQGGDVAISFVNIDSPASESVLQEMRKIDNIVSVKQVRFDA